MPDSVNCVYKTPCDYCTKFNQICNIKNYGDNIKQSEELSYVEEVLNNFGISLRNKKMQYRPINEVMTDICKKFRVWRNSGVSREEFEARKHLIYKTLVGVKYVNEIY